jgi:hypothetical protein
MRIATTVFVLSSLLPNVCVSVSEAQTDAPVKTKEFEIRGDRSFLGGHHVKLWGIRSGNALHSETVTQRHIRAMDTMNAHGINTIGVYIQGSNGGHPDPDAGTNGFGRDGKLKKDVAARLERLIREADKRGMVVMVGLFSQRKDQDLEGDAAVKRAVEETARFLNDKGLANVFVDLVHEFDHTVRMDQPLFREPGGEEKKAKLTAWFKAIAPTIEVGVCPYIKSPTGTSYPGMDVRIIQKEMEIPSEGFVVNVETQKQDSYEDDGVFNEGHVEFVLDDCRKYAEAPNAAMLFHAAFIQGISNRSGTAPHAEIGGNGTSPSDRGVRFYYDWVKKNVGAWQYPNHVKTGGDSE